MFVERGALLCPAGKSQFLQQSCCFFIYLQSEIALGLCDDLMRLPWNFSQQCQILTEIPGIFFQLAEFRGEAVQVLAERDAKPSVRSIACEGNDLRKSRSQRARCRVLEGVFNDLTGHSRKEALIHAFLSAFLKD